MPRAIPTSPAGAPFSANPLPGALLLLWAGGTMFWWALAFPPFREQAPRWLETVQAVCFGAPPGGLPAPYGWGALIAAPLAMLAVLAVGWGREILAGWRALIRRPLGGAVTGLLCLAMVAQTGWVAWSVGARLNAAAPSWEPVATGPMPDNYPRLNTPAPAFALDNQNGDRVSLHSLRGQVTFLTFAFGHCSTICPVMVRNVAAAAEQSGPPAPGLVIITLDAWRDTPATLSDILERWNLPPSAHLLSGPPPQVNRVLDRYRVTRQRDEFNGDIDHLALVYVLDARGRIAYALLNPTPAWLAEAARRAALPAG